MDAFELSCWRRLLGVLWTARRSTQSILKGINPEYWLRGRMLRLKLQYFGHLVQRADSWKRPWCWERLKDKEKSSTGWDVRQHRQLNRHESEQWASVGLSLCCLPRPSHNLTTCNHQLPQQRHLQEAPKAKCVHTIGSGHRHCWPWSLGSGTRGTVENTNYHSSDSRPPATLSKRHTVVNAVNVSSLSQMDLMPSQTQCHLMPLCLAPCRTFQCSPTQRWKAFPTEIII